MEARRQLAERKAKAAAEVEEERQKREQERKEKERKKKRKEKLREEERIQTLYKADRAPKGSKRCLVAGQEMEEAKKLTWEQKIERARG